MPKSNPGKLSPDLKADLKRAGLDFAADQVTRLLYSTDASIYQIMPVAVIWPRDKDQVCAAVEIARDHDLPLLPRGSGTSLAGQAIGQALILDLSRWMDRVLDISPQARTAAVQPGVVLGSLNRQLRPLGLTFGPDPASADRATIGGVIGNNATGAHSILYGMTHDHLLEAEVVLADGSLVLLKKQSPQELAGLQERSSLEGRIYRRLPDLLQEHQQAIAKDFPRIFRNAAGYNLQVLARQDEINPAVLLAGSEGTLGIITSATLNLVPLPRYTTLYLIHFNELQAALEAVPAILESGPSSVELIDRMLIELARANPAYRHHLDAIQGGPEAVLAVEYQGENLSALSGLESRLAHFGPTVPLLEADQQSRIWKARSVGLGILQSKRGDAKPTAFIEDAAVPVEHLAEYALEIKRFSQEIGVGATAFYAHASAGCLHIRPQVDLKSEQGIRQMRLLAEKSLELVMRFGGTTSGEHGEGIARGEFSRRLHGPELTQAFKQVKELFDPEYLLNPGKVVDPPPMDRDDLLRYGLKYQAAFQPRDTLLSFQEELGFDRAVEMCNGAGVCRQRDEGVMCPSFKASRDEGSTTRGRSNMLRAAISGKLGPDGFTSRELYQVLDLCLSCQACSSECPSAVDLAKLKAEFLYHYHQVHGLPFRSWFFAHIADISRLVQPFAAVVNPLLRSPLAKGLTLMGIHPRRELPSFARERFTTWYRKQGLGTKQGVDQGVVFFYDTYLEYNYPHIGQAVVSIFQKAGLDLVVVKGQADSGRPAYSKGDLRFSQRLARKNLEILGPYAAAGLPIVGCEPSDIVMLKNEYRWLNPGPAADQVAASAMLVEDYLLGEIASGRIQFSFDHQPRRILYHGHCQQKAHLGTSSTVKLLGQIPDCAIQEIKTTCCGMAGAFGYEKEHYQLSMAVAEIGLAPQIRASDPETIISASGTSCREQIAHTTLRKALHPLEVFAAALA